MSDKIKNQEEVDMMDLARKVFVETTYNFLKSKSDLTSSRLKKAKCERSFNFGYHLKKDDDLSLANFCIVTSSGLENYQFRTFVEMIKEMIEKGTPLMTRVAIGAFLKVNRNNTAFEKMAESLFNDIFKDLGASESILMCLDKENEESRYIILKEGQPKRIVDNHFLCEQIAKKLNETEIDSSVLELLK